jgi:hypothetical protein
MPNIGRKTRVHEVVVVLDPNAKLRRRNEPWGMN